MTRNIIISTSSQKINFQTPVELTLEQILLCYKLPTNLFQGFITEDNGRIKPIPLNIYLQDINESSNVILQCIRNIDLKQILPQKTLNKKIENPINILRDYDIGNHDCEETVTEIDDNVAKDIVSDKVKKFMQENSDENTLIVGISGGGDSNTLVKSLKDYSTQHSPTKKYLCFTLTLDPIWPEEGARRAQELCQKYSVDHRIFDEKAIENFLGMRASLQDFYKEFLNKFGRDTQNFFATYIIARVARKLCIQSKTNEFCLGFNREDLLAEIIFALMNGRKPLEYPVRMFDNMKLLMPLWDIPKKLLDSCYPKYSLENYQEREVGDERGTFQRSLIFYLGHAFDDIYNNFGLSFMIGIKKLFKNNWGKLKQKTAKNDLYIYEYANGKSLQEVEVFLKKYF